MVSRAYLTDSGSGIVVDAGAGGLWLVSSKSVLLPDQDRLRLRAAEDGGIPVEYGVPRLVKVAVAWGTGSQAIDLANPVVVPHPAGGSVAAVSLKVPASFGDKIRAGDGPVPVAVESPSIGAGPRLGDDVAVTAVSSTETGMWPRLLWTRVSSDPGFHGEDGAVALNMHLRQEEAGAPVFAFDDGSPVFCGVAESVGNDATMLIPVSQIAEVVAAAGRGN